MDRAESLFVEWVELGFFLHQFTKLSDRPFLINMYNKLYMYRKGHANHFIHQGT